MVKAISGPYREKRTVDLALLAMVSVPAIVIGAMCAAAIAIARDGPILFRQERIGRDGHPFEVLKFRTMLTGDNPMYPDAARITRVGRWLRRFSLDELPQLVNVGRGEMSIVGPRPAPPYQVERYTTRQRGRLVVRPGLTGLAQICGRNELSWTERIEIDLAYAEQQSLGLDLRIIVRTVGVVLSGQGLSGHPIEDDIAAPPNSTRRGEG